MRTRRIVWMAIGAVVVLAACSGGETSVAVDDVWARTSPAAATNAAFYMELQGGSTADTLVSADAAVCGITELHVSVMNDGVMSMQHLPDGIDVPSDETVMLEPGSFHVMCIDRQQEFVTGESVSLTLEFAEAGTVIVNAEIRDS